MGNRPLFQAPNKPSELCKKVTCKVNQCSVKRHATLCVKCDEAVYKIPLNCEKKIGGPNALGIPSGLGVPYCACTESEPSLGFWVCIEWARYFAEISGFPKNAPKGGCISWVALEGSGTLHEQAEENGRAERSTHVSLTACHLPPTRVQRSCAMIQVWH